MRVEKDHVMFDVFNFVYIFMVNGHIYICVFIVSIYIGKHRYFECLAANACMRLYDFVIYY